MRVYIAGPMTGYPHDNHPAFHEMEAALSANGYKPINPARNFAGQKDLTRSEVMRLDITLLTHCEGIVFLDQWDQSVGATAEHVIAAQLSLHRLIFMPDDCEFIDIGPIEPYLVTPPLNARAVCIHDHSYPSIH